MTIVKPNLLYFKVKPIWLRHFRRGDQRFKEVNEVKLIVVMGEGQMLYEAESPPRGLEYRLPFKECFIEYVPPVRTKEGDEIAAFNAIEFEDKGEEISRSIGFASYSPQVDKLGDGLLFATQRRERMIHNYQRPGLLVVKDGKRPMPEKVPVRPKSCELALFENTLAFFNCENVRIVPSRMSSKSQRKRIKRGLPLKPPPYYECKVSVPPTRYIGSNSTAGERAFGYRFDVRGHFRLLRAERFVRKRGQWVWVRPHQKGQDVYVPKTYVFEGEERET